MRISEGVRSSRQGARVCALLPVGVCWSFSACPEVFCLQEASAQLLSRRFAFLAGRFGRACTKMTISCEGTVSHSTYNTKTWNNSPAFRLACDTIGTGKAIYWRPSPFLHNLSSILYMGSREGAPTGVPSSCRAASCIGRCASGVTHQASFVVCYELCDALRAAFASPLETFSKKCLTEIAVLLI